MPQNRPTPQELRARYGEDGVRQMLREVTALSEWNERVGSRLVREGKARIDENGVYVLIKNNGKVQDE